MKLRCCSQFMKYNLISRWNKCVAKNIKAVRKVSERFSERKRTEKKNYKAEKLSKKWLNQV